MKKRVFFIASLVSFFLGGCSGDSDTNDSGIINSDPNCNQIVTIPDANFKARLVAGGYGTAVTLEGSTIVDANGDGEIQVCEAENVGSVTIDQAEINSIEGILKFKNIQTISFKNNNISQSLDLTSLKRLVYVMLTNNAIPSLKVNGLSKLEYLACNDNNLQVLDVSNLGSLKTVFCQYNSITNLNIQSSRKIEVLHVYNNSISVLNVSHLSELKQLYIQNNELTQLNISGLIKLQGVACYTNQLQSINASGCVNLTDLECSENNLIQLNLTNCSLLSILKCRNNNLATLSFSGLINLSNIDCGANEFTSLDMRDCLVMNLLDVSFSPNLQSLIVKNGSIAPQGVSIYQCPSLTNICCDVEEQSDILSDVQTYGYNCAVVINCF